ncbi:MAG: serine/threonine protein kinase [Chitinispirillaceae bacterium]|nr:serine/threonine protein kinase [Chitinispirillaceae bacterium]
MIPRFPNGFSHPVQLGTGGFGSVYRARQAALNRMVALKFIVEKNAAARAVLIKEASMQGGMHIQGIPQVYDVKEISGQVCLIMQWVKGCSLRDVIERKIALHYKYAIASEIIRITASLHEREYVHRDIKPENIIISSEGVFFIDFGLSLHVFKDARQTMADVVKGTPEYIAPELWKRRQGRDADLKRADVFSMGKVIRELVGDDPLPECIASCLQEKPEVRPRSAVEVLRQWENEGARPVMNWSDIAEPCASEILARQLHNSAQELLSLRRIEEAYDLLVECLQMHPESPEALESMARFPLIKRRKNAFTRRKSVIAGGAVLLLLGFGTTSVLLKRPSFDKVAIAPRRGDGRSLFMSSSRARVDGMDLSLPFKDEFGTLATLAGNLIIVSHPETGSLYIDGIRIATIPNVFHLSAQSPEHRLVWRTGSGAVLWKETITTLPFEIKRVCIKER